MCSRLKPLFAAAWFIPCLTSTTSFGIFARTFLSRAEGLSAKEGRKGEELCTLPYPPSSYRVNPFHQDFSNPRLQRGLEINLAEEREKWSKEGRKEGGFRDDEMKVSLIISPSKEERRKESMTPAA